jgi:outer membrane protein assembly factor BamB
MRVATLALCCAAAPARPVRAEPVPIGRYAEIHIGVSHRNAYATSGADAQRTGRSRAHAPAVAPRRLWSATLGQPRLLPPAVMADGTLIIGSAGGVHALDPRTGAQRWFAAVGAVRFTPSITPEGELVVVAGNKLWVLNRSGAPRELALNAAVTGEPLVLESGATVVPGPDGTVQTLGLDGMLLGSSVTVARQSVLQFTALAGGDMIAVAGPAQEVSLLSLRGGDERTLRLSQRVQTSPVVGNDDTIWLLGDGGTLWAMTVDGSVRASIELGQGGGTDDPALGWDGALRIGLRYGEVACFAASGRELWRHGVDGPPGAMLIDAEDTLLFVGPRGVLYAIDRGGDLRWRQPLELRGVGRPVLAADGTIYVVARSGQVEAWR